jgi:signal transduction histidine kinase
MADSLFEEMRRRIGFRSSDAENIRSLAQYTLPAREQLADTFYEWLFSDPQALRIFTGGAEQRARQRRVFVKWYEELFGGVYDEAYFRSRLSIGHTHVRVRLPQHYMFMAMEFVWQETKTILLSAAVPEDELHRKLASFHKLLALELAMMLESYKESYTSKIREEERTVAEEKLTRSEHLATIGQLAASLAHEIKNPLAGISGAIQVIRDGMHADDPHRAIIHEILGQIDRLDAAVKDLLVYSRPRPPKLSPCDLSNVMVLMVKLMRDAHLFKHIPIDFQQPEALPQIAADTGHLEQLIMNLLMNAAQACRDGQQIRVELAAEGDRVRMSIIDSGSGMDEIAFEPFFTTKAKGTGLGLPICKKIVDAHNAVISLESRPERGTRVTVEFPVFIPVAAPMSAPT